MKLCPCLTCLAKMQGDRHTMLLACWCMPLWLCWRARRTALSSRMMTLCLCTWSCQLLQVRAPSHLWCIHDQLQRYIKTAYGALIEMFPILTHLEWYSLHSCEKETGVLERHVTMGHSNRAATEKISSSRVQWGTNLPSDAKGWVEQENETEPETAMAPWICGKKFLLHSAN